jgi:methionyl-tRNA formyltransferase
MEAGLDTGPVLACRSTQIRPDDTGSRLHDRLAKLGGELLGAELDALEEGTLSPVPQDDTKATYAGKLDKAEARLDWKADAEDLARKVRAFNAWPVAETTLAGRQLRIWDAVPVSEQSTAAPGTVLAADQDGILVACGRGKLRLLSLQLPGGRPVAARDFVNAHKIADLRLGEAQ